MDISKTFIRWLSNFLCNRSIRVVIDGINSNLYPVNFRVPQGSVISPTLFLLFLNDHLCLTTNPIYSFADDSSLCHSYSYNAHPNINVGVIKNCMDDTLNSDLVKIEEWGRVKEWTLTHAKLNVVCYRKSEHPVLAKTFISVVWQLQNQRFLLF